MNRDLYKKNIDKDERQELRRQTLLQEQKLQRLELQDERRRLQQVVSKHSYTNAKYKQRTFQELYGHDISLQLSEWLREKPEDLCEWLLVPCPKGQRCLVVSTRGRTKMFSKTGRFRMSFKSGLPGGGGEDGNSAAGGGFCILDCIYSAENDNFHVLDVLYYGKQCFLDCETQFRFFWLKSKFEEYNNSEFKWSKTDGNFKAFHLLNPYDMDNKVTTARALQSYPLWTDNSPELDGFLFYHKESSYTCGPTPLVCWLFPFMVDEVLHININSIYERPPNYSNAWLYMEDFDKELARKRQRRQSKQMDSASGTDSPNSSILSLSHVDREMEGVQDEDDEHIDSVLKNVVESKRDDNERNSLKHIMKAERLLELEGIAEH